MITLKDFEKLELRIGEIISVEDIANADKLYRLDVDIGGKQIQLVAGIKPYYTKDELLGKKIVVLVNLQPIQIRGVFSEGMLLAAVNDNEVSLLTVDKDIEVGSKVA